jgi:hypothetical protein
MVITPSQSLDKMFKHQEAPKSAHISHDYNENINGLRSRAVSADSNFVRSRAQSEEIAKYIIEVMSSDEEDENVYYELGRRMRFSPSQHFKDGELKTRTRSRLASDESIIAKC